MTLTQHPLSAAFPAMSEDEYLALRDDIDDHGQRDPVIVHESMVLDGWHRYRACMDLGIEPMTKPFGDDDPVEFVLSHNLHRRHLTASQRAMAVVSCNQWAPSHRPDKVEPGSTLLTNKALAKAAGTTTRTITDAKVAHKAGIGEAVKEGALTAKQAAKIARAKPEKPVTKPKFAAQKPTKPTPASQLTDAEYNDAMSDIDPDEEVKRLQLEVRYLEEQNKALHASDTAAELAKQIKIRQGLEGRLSLEMEKVNQLQRELDGYGKWYAELRKVTGKDRRSEITKILRAAVESAQ